MRKWARAHSHARPAHMGTRWIDAPADHQRRLRGVVDVASTCNVGEFGELAIPVEAHGCAVVCGHHVVPFVQLPPPCVGVSVLPFVRSVWPLARMRMQPTTNVHQADADAHARVGFAVFFFACVCARAYAHARLGAAGRHTKYGAERGHLERVSVLVSKGARRCFCGGFFGGEGPSESVFVVCEVPTFFVGTRVLSKRGWGRGPSS